MLKLINIGIFNGTDKLSSTVLIKRIVDTINNNSSVFTAEVNSTNSFRFNITSEHINISDIGYYSNSSSTIHDCGLTLAIDDDKEFLIILPRIILNTQTGNPDKQSDGFMTSTSSNYPGDVMMCSIGKDINNTIFTVYGNASKSYYQGLSCWLDIGQHGTDEYTTEGDFILRQGAIRNHIVPELFFSMTRLGSCGDIIEKDGHKYVCIAGPIFYQIS